MTKCIVNDGIGNKALISSNLGLDLSLNIAFPFRANFISTGGVGFGTTSPNFAVDIGGGDLRMESTHGIRWGGTGSNATNFVMYDSVSNMPSGKLVIATANRAISYFSITKSGTGATSEEGKIQFGKYGSGNITGTATQRLAVDSSGNVIEVPIGAGAVDGSGTANDVVMWSDSDTITDAPIAISGNDATFAGTITLNGQISDYKEGETILIPQGIKHRIENKTSLKVVIIEVQTGTYLGEDDIERFDDNYGRM